MVLGYSLFGCTPETSLQEGKLHVSRLLTLMSVLWILLHIRWVGVEAARLEATHPLSVPDGNSFMNRLGE